VLSRLFELRDEVRVFFIDLESPFTLTERLNDYSWLAVLAYMADIFTHLNTLNLSMQGGGITIFNVEDKIEAMIKKLELWARRLSKRNFDAFQNLKTFLESADEELSNEVLEFFTQHLQDLQCSFREYFPPPDESKNWIKDPFNVDIDKLTRLTAAEENGLIEISTDSALKLQFKENSLANFWLHVRTDYPELSYKALKVLIPFPTTYLCEKAFSALMYLKNRYRNRVRNVESDLRIQLSEIKPNIEKLVAEMQHQPSH
jgi:hypothetical protein